MNGKDAVGCFGFIVWAIGALAFALVVGWKALAAVVTILWGEEILRRWRQMENL